jgi:nitrite reductase (NO-forming)
MEAVPFRRYDPALPPLQPGRPREVHLVARNETVAISGDTAMRAWTFNGTVPGPILHLRQGDPVQVTLTNQGTLAHSIDLHAARIDPEIAFRSIAPGESISYTFTPQYAGAFLYHCGTAPLLLHIGSGMYGAVIVDPPAPLPPAREFVLVHSGFYLDDEGSESEGGGGEVERERGEVRIYDPSYRKMLSAFPDQVAFNGHSYQYRAAPITVRRGERVRFHVVNAGPTEDCSFHIVGEVFDTVYLGAPPGNTIHGVQTYSVPAGGGMIFELMASIPGRFTFVDHKFGHGDKGAAGLLVVEP